MGGARKFLQMHREVAIKVSTPERKRSKSRSDFSLCSCGDTHCVSKPVRPTGGTNWSEDVKRLNIIDPRI